MQANEVGTRMSREEISHVFSSPFDRCVDTATRVIGDRNIPIKLEPGLCEALYLCQRPPGWEDPVVIQKVSSYFANKVLDLSAS